MEHMIFQIFMLCLLFNSLCAFGLVGASARSKRSLKLAAQFESIYQFGDSLSDTGNYIREPEGANAPYKGLPYGESYHPTGRASDGLLIIDNIARYFHLPLLNPYLASRSDFSHGVNFAVAGANATGGANTNSLAKQLEWFKSHLRTTFSNNPTAIKEKLQKSLVLMGEIGGNDFNDPFFKGNLSIEEASKLVPVVVKTIKDAVEEVISLGANNIVVPGNFPIGCVPIYLATFATNDTSKYDELECLKDYNAFANSYNQQLIQAINQLQQVHPDVAIVYADYYAALTSVISNAPQLGIEQDGTKKACCGSGHNAYNFGDIRCGPGSPVCQEPSKRLNWDGIHMTQQGYKYVSEVLLKQIIPTLQERLLKRNEY